MNRELINATKNNNLQEVERLLAAGADVHAEYDEALRVAADKSYLEVVRVLLAAGADVHAEYDEALRAAAIKGHLEIVRVLLAAGANVHADNDYALGVATIRGHLEIVRVLLAHGANVHAINDYALRKASENGHLEIVRVLLAHGANVHAMNDYALRKASENGHLEIVRVLLAHGANVHAFSAEDLQEIDNPEILALLSEYGDNPIVPASVQERRRAALEQEQKNEQLRIAALDEVKNREEKAPENPFIEANCSSTENLYGDPLKDTDDIIVFELENKKGDCYLKEELKLLRSDQYVRGIGEKAYKLPWSNVWITKRLKEFAETMEGYGPIPLRRSENIVGYNRNNVLWVLAEN